MLLCWDLFLLLKYFYTRANQLTFNGEGNCVGARFLLFHLHASGN